MGHESTVTSKGQTTIPVEIRDRLGLQAGDRILYTEATGKVVIERLPRSALELAGIFHDPARVPLTLEEMKAEWPQAAIDRYEQAVDDRS